MVDEIKLAEEVQRGDKAEKLLNDPILQDAFRQCEEHITKMFKDAPVRDEEGIVKAKYLLHSLSLVKSALEQTLRNGKLSAKTLEDRRRGVSYLGDIWKMQRK